MSRRGPAAIVILCLWVAGLGLLVRRELFRPDTARFAEIGLRVTPGATYYAVLQDGRHVGFASSTIDTTPGGIRMVDYLVADLPVGGRTTRTSARTRVQVSRGMRLRSFHLQADGMQGPLTASGQMEGDSVIAFVVRAGTGAAADTQRVRVDGPVLLPLMAPLAIALAQAPAVGATYDIPIFDPTAPAPRTVVVRITAESLFVVYDSATFDVASARWTGALPDTVRAWQAAGAGGPVPDGWVDAQGRLVRATPSPGVTLERMPYELAFENWQLAKGARGEAAPAADGDLLETTVIAAGAHPGRSLHFLRVALRDADLAGYDLVSERQRMHHDTLTVTRDDSAALAATYRLGRVTRAVRPTQRELMIRSLRAEPLIETMDPDVRSLAARLRQGSDDPAAVARRIHDWVHDSLTKRPTAGMPSARAVLAARAGDCNEHTQLFVALARAARLPARVASGLLYLNGKFYSHAWPEVFLGRWVAVDPTLGQFPADAAHLRFVVGGLDRQAEMLRLIGTLDIDVLEAR